MSQPTLARPRSRSAEKLDAATLAAPRAASLLRAESLPLAYILGAWAANVRVGTEADGRISFAGEELGRLRLIQHRWKQLLGSSPPIQPVAIGAVSSYRITVFSEALASHVHEVSHNNTRVPWEHLESSAEKVAFLRGMFDHGGWIALSSSPGIGISKDGGIELLRDVALVMKECGLLPLIVAGKYPSLVFRERGEWLKFRKLIGMRVRRDIVDLSELCELRGTKNGFSPEQYAAAMRLAGRQTRGHKKLVASEIEARTGVPANTVRDWITRHQIPRSVVRQLVLEELARESPDGRVVSYLYRHLGVSSELARRCAARWWLERVVARVAADREGFERAFGEDERVYRLLSAKRAI